MLQKSWSKIQKSMLKKSGLDLAESRLKNLRVDGEVAVPMVRSFTTGRLLCHLTQLWTMWLSMNYVI